MFRLCCSLCSVVHVVALLVIFGQVIFGEVVASSGSDCYCEFGCYMPEGGFKVDCCNNLCEEAEERKVAAECKKKCPYYQEKVNSIAKENENVKFHKDRANYYERLYNEASKSLTVVKNNLNVSDIDKQRCLTKLREIQSSGKLISGLATPLCLFGALIIVLVVSICLYQNNEVCRRQTEILDDLDFPNEGNESYGRANYLAEDKASEPCFAPKPSALASGFPQHCVDRPPDYSSKVGRASSRSSQEDNAIAVPCVARDPSHSSLEQFSKPVNQYLQNSVAAQYQAQQQAQLQTQQQMPFHYSQQFLQLPQHNVTNNQVKQNEMLMSQLEAIQKVQRDARENANNKRQGRQGDKNSRANNEAESCAFRLAHLDFDRPQPPQQQQQQQKHAKINNIGSTNTKNESDLSPSNL